MRKLFSFFLLGLFLMNVFAVQAQTADKQVRSKTTFTKGWKFTRTDSPDFILPDYNDSKWESVVVPHDWAIYGPFSIHNDKQNVAIAQDGQKDAMEHAGRTGGLPFVGVGWYRLNFEVPQLTQDQKATLIIDGAMSNAEVYVNGEKAGYWPYGYNTFHLDVTPFVKAGKGNQLAIRLENQTESSRWYPGAGLYRNVHLVVTGDAHVPVWGTQLTTPIVNKDMAKVSIITTLDKGKKENADYRIETSIVNPQGQVVANDRSEERRVGKEC